MGWQRDPHLALGFGEESSASHMHNDPQQGGEGPSAGQHPCLRGSVAALPVFLLPYHRIWYTVSAQPKFVNVTDTPETSSVFP
jgi:hypothetical protein